MGDIVISRDSYLEFLAVAAFIAVISVFAVIIFWLYYPYNVLVIKDQPVKILRYAQKAGDYTVFQIDYCKYSDARGEVTWDITSKQSVTLLPAYTDMTPKSCAIIEDPVLIPSNLPPGTYYITWRVDYHVNPLRNVIYEFKSQTFAIK